MVTYFNSAMVFSHSFFDRAYTQHIAKNRKSAFITKKIYYTVPFQACKKNQN
jgi:hypothetical protein